MKSFHHVLVTAFAVALPICAIGGVALAQDYPPPPPPPTYVATIEPVYYNNVPHYWYGNHWYWRDAGGNWQYYRDEPAFLRDHRVHYPPQRHFEERRDWHGRR